MHSSNVNIKMYLEKPPITQDSIVWISDIFYRKHAHFKKNGWCIFSAGFNKHSDQRPEETVSSLEVKTQQVLIKHAPLMCEGCLRSKVRSLISAFYNRLFFFLVEKQCRLLLQCEADLRVSPGWEMLGKCFISRRVSSSVN